MEKKKHNIALWIIFILMAAGTVALFIFSNQVFGAGTIFSRQVSDIPALQYLYEHGIPNVLRTLQIVTCAIALILILGLFAKITFRDKRTITIAKLILNFIKWAVAIAAFFMILAAWGADTTMILASAGVLTLVIGLGSQALVADILAGIFIVFEGDFQVGDIILVDSWRGEVVSIGIRTTRLMDAGGNVKIINNSDIRSIVNQTKELSLALCYVSVSYNERIERIESVFADNIDKIKEKIPAIVEGPFYKGVSELGESSVVLLFVAKCKETDIYQVQRDLNRAIKILFDNNGIEIPFNQLVVHMEEDSDVGKVSRAVREKAEDFAEEQKELSKHIDVKK